LKTLVQKHDGFIELQNQWLLITVLTGSSYHIRDDTGEQQILLMLMRAFLFFSQHKTLEEMVYFAHHGFCLMFLIPSREIRRVEMIQIRQIPARKYHSKSGIPT
jgi:hypothetical protein